MRIYFSRHGESEANLLHEHANRGFKYGLTEMGRAQAAALAALLADVPIARVYCSPLRRAVETAEIAAQAKAEGELLELLDRHNLRRVVVRWRKGSTDAFQEMAARGYWFTA